MKSVDYFMSPSLAIREAVGVLGTFYQVTNQETLDTYFKKAGRSHFSGDFFKIIEMKEMEEFFRDQEKPYGPLKQALFLRERNENHIDARLFSQLGPEDTERLLKLLKDYGPAKTMVDRWMAPLLKDDFCARAVADALKLDLDKFQVLELATLDEGHTTQRVTFFDHILQVDNVETLIAWLRMQKELRDCLMLTVVRNPKREWRSFFYIFLIHNGKLYSIDNSDRRLNEDNTAGDRNPDRYVQQNYHGAGIWLPIHLMLGEYKKKGTALTQTHKGLYKLGSWTELEASHPQFVYWFGFFQARMVDALIVKEVKTELGFTRSDIPKLLGDGKAPKFVADSVQDISSKEYLLNIYKDVSTALVIRPENFQLALGTREHLSMLVAYKTRQNLAEQMQKAVAADFRKNARRVYAEIRKIVKSKDREWVVRKALQDKAYPYLHYQGFGSFESESEKRRPMKGPSQFREAQILRVSDGWYGRNAFRVAELNDSSRCLFHPNFEGSKIYELVFKDYRQFASFFEMDKSQLPPEMVAHLHQHAELYTGNSILDDTDPLDEVFDPWFRKDVNDGYRSEYPKFRVVFRICGKCVRALGPKKKS